MPAVATAQPGPGEKKVLIEELPEWAQLPFDGYKCALQASTIPSPDSRPTLIVSSSECTSVSCNSPICPSLAASKRLTIGPPDPVFAADYAWPLLL